MHRCPPSFTHGFGFIRAKNNRVKPKNGRARSLVSWHGARNPANQMAACLCLPPRVGDRAFFLSDHPVVPDPASGLIGSPTVPSSLRLLRFLLFGQSSPLFMIDRMACGGV